MRKVVNWFLKHYGKIAAVIIVAGSPPVGGYFLAPVIGKALGAAGHVVIAGHVIGLLVYWVVVSA